MELSKVVGLPVEERLLYWIKERWSIYQLRKSGKPKPWTDDEILRSYRFCNVRRIDDKTSQWLLNNWYTPYRDHPNVLLACVLARQLNNIDSLGEVGFPKRWNPNRVEKILNARAAAGIKNFSAAYMITGTLGGSKVHQIVRKVVDPVHRNPPAINPGSMRESVTALLPYAGFSTFMAGQVVADLRWAVSGSWVDKNDWAPVGPGSSRGLCRYLGRPLEERLNQEEFNVKFADLLSRLRERVEVPKMEAMDFQNCLCEWDKYERALFGEGRPKQRYDGGVDG